MDKQELIEVRCPYYYTSKRTEKVYKCNSLLGKATPGSCVELMCRKCHLPSIHYFDEQAKSTTGVRVKKLVEDKLDVQ